MNGHVGVDEQELVARQRTETLDRVAQEGEGEPFRFVHGRCAAGGARLRRPPASRPTRQRNDVEVLAVAQGLEFLVGFSPGSSRPIIELVPLDVSAYEAPVTIPWR